MTDLLESGAVILISGSMSLAAIFLARFLGRARPTDTRGLNRYECGIQNQISDHGFVYTSEHGTKIAIFIVIEASTVFTLVSLLSKFSL
ncbi:MAG: hypothetical protein LBJ77_02090 [Holosporales bacterium]|nr:hypothetical protein [Holosporales bacterium]